MKDVVHARYRIDRLIGHGGMGEVYLAYDLRLDRPVALKFCLPSSVSGNAKRRIQHEARAASRLNHPAIATVFDYEEDEEGRPFIVMEYVEGQPLSARLRDGPLPVGEALRVARDVASALEEAHARGCLHRDLKPSNVMLTPRGTAKVLDFGLAVTREAEAPSGEEETLSAAIHGTPAYMSPEQAHGEALDGRSDLFSLGAVLYECLTGDRPFGAATHTASLVKVVQDQPPAPSTRATGIPPEVDLLVEQMLRKDRAERPQSAGEVRRAIELLQGSAGSGGSLPRPARKRSRAGRLAWMAGAALGAVVLLSLWGREQGLGPFAARLPQEAGAWYAQGVRALQEGSWWRASRLLEATVQAAPGYAPARARLAQTWLELDEVDKAREQMMLAAPAGRSLRKWKGKERLMIEAVHHLVLFQNQPAIAAYQRYIDGVPESERGAARCELGRCYERAGQSREARETYLAALREDKTLAAAHLRIGQIDARKFDYKEAEKHYRAAEALYSTSNDLEGLAEVHRLRAQSAIRQSRWEEAARLIQEARKLAAATGDVYMTIRVLQQVVFAELERGDTGQAEKTAQEAAALAGKSGSQALDLRARLELGNLFLMKKAYGPAEEHFRASLGTAQAIHSAAGEARAHSGLGSLYQMKGQCEEALPHLEHAQAYYVRNNQRQESQKMLIALARVQRDLSQFDAAEGSFRKLGEEARASGAAEIEGYAEEGLATIYLAREKYGSALEHALRAARLTEQKGRPINHGYALTLASRASALLGRVKQAEEAATEAREIAVSKSNPGLHFSALSALAAAKLEAGDYPAAARMLALAREQLSLPSNRLQLSKLTLAEATIDALAGRRARGLRTCEKLLAESAAAAKEGGWPGGALGCAVVAQLAGAWQRASELALHSVATLEREKRAESVWMARAILAARTGDPSAKEQARKAWSAFEDSLSAQDRGAYRARPVVAFLQHHLI